MQGQVTRQLDELNVVYRDLSTRRATLKPGDQAGIEAFNKEAARYTALLEEARKTKAQLDQVMSNP